MVKLSKLGIDVSYLTEPAKNHLHYLNLTANIIGCLLSPLYAALYGRS